MLHKHHVRWRNQSEPHILSLINSKYENTLHLLRGKVLIAEWIPTASL
jgi:hypothetical protein